MPSFTDTSTQQDKQFQMQTMDEVMDLIEDFVWGLDSGLVDGIKHKSVGIPHLLQLLKNERGFYRRFIESHYKGVE